jgi:hypothetical protein
LIVRFAYEADGKTIEGQLHLSGLADPLSVVIHGSVESAKEAQVWAAVLLGFAALTVLPELVENRRRASRPRTGVRTTVSMAGEFHGRYHVFVGGMSVRRSCQRDGPQPPTGSSGTSVFCRTEVRQAPVLRAKRPELGSRSALARPGCGLMCAAVRQIGR